MGRLITIKEWAELHNISASAVRHKIRRGKILSAKKLGGVWFIDEEEDNIDHRFNDTAVSTPIPEQDPELYADPDTYDRADLEDSMYGYVESCLREEYLDHEDNLINFMYENYELLLELQVNKEELKKLYFECLNRIQEDE